MAEPDRQIYTDDRIAAYQGYMPTDWGEKVIGPTPTGIVLERLLLDLGLAWRSASYTAQMPATAIRAMHAAAVGRAGFFTPNATIVEYTDRIVGRLIDRVPALVPNRTVVNRIKNELTTIATEFRDRARKAKQEVSLEPIWAQFMNEPAFRISLWSSQRIAYVAFYNAYEAFLIDCLKVGSGLTSLRVTMKKEFKAALRSALGADITADCWSHPEINIPRVVRHVLSHNGGRVTTDLKALPHKIKLIGEELQIVPEDLHRMLRRLRTAVEHIVALAKGDPKFQASVAKLPQPSEDDEE